MDADQIPPVIAAPAADAPEQPIARWRWWLHLLILTSFPLMAGLMGILLSSKSTALLPATSSGLFRVMTREVIFFAGIFLVAWVVSRVNRRQLLLPWRGGAMPVVWGIAYSVALRLFIMVLATTAMLFWLAFKAMLTGAQPHEADQHVFRPRIEHLVNFDALVSNPLYFVLMVTFVSFALGGFREELWRAAMLAGINALWPQAMDRRAGQAVAITIVAILFGLAHTTQGWAGVGVTTLLGIGLGAIMVWHRSIWEAAIAHGLFDATTFVFLYIAEKYFPGQVPGF